MVCANPLTCLVIVVPQLTLCNGKAFCSTEALLCLGGMSRLQRLELELNSIPALAFPPLRGLVNLKTCSVGLEGKNNILHTLCDVAALFTLPHLTSLQLWTVQHDSSTLTTSEAVACWRAVAPLRSLRNLHTLKFGKDFIVDDPIFDALKQITGLTSLHVGRICLADPTPGHLPLLSSFPLYGNYTPTQLQQTLLPLQPLAALHSYGFQVLRLSVGSITPAAAVVEAEHLRQAAEILAKTDMAEIGVDLTPANPHVVLSPLDLAQGLAPLAEAISALSMMSMGQDEPLGVEWAVLSNYLPDLDWLTLGECQVSDFFLAAVMCHWPSVGTLHLIDCIGLEDDGWCALAAVRGSELTVKVVPVLPEETVQACLEVQDKVFQKRFLTFE